MNNKRIIENFRLQLISEGKIGEDEQILTKGQIEAGGLSIDPKWIYYECQIWMTSNDQKHFYKKKIKLYPSKQILAI